MSAKTRVEMVKRARRNDRRRIFLLLVVSTGSTTEELVIEVLEMTDGGFFVGCGFDRLNHRIFAQPPKKLGHIAP